jgi:hypothetical protein
VEPFSTFAEQSSPRQDMERRKINEERKYRRK